MASFRPEVIALIHAIHALKAQATSEPLSSSEADLVVKAIAKLELSLHTESRPDPDSECPPVN